MIYQVCKDSRQKITSVTIDDDCLCVRIFSPTVIANRLNNSNLVLTTNSIKNQCFNINDGEYICTHEVFMNKKNALQKSGSHIIFYTSSLSSDDEIYIDDSRDIKSRSGIEVLVELLCHSIDVSFKDCDMLIQSDKTGQLFTNIPANTINLYESNDEFNFKTSLSAPKTIKQNQFFTISINMVSYSGNPVTGTVLSECLSGYIPNRELVLSDGNGKLRCCSLFVEDEFIFAINNQTFRVKVNE